MAGTHASRRTTKDNARGVSWGGAGDPTEGGAR